MPTCASVLLCKLKSMSDVKVILTSGVEAEIAYVGKVGPDIEAYRVILKIWSTLPKETAGLIKEYEVWVSEEYLEDHGFKANEEGAKKFSLEAIEKRFKASGNTTPRENGMKVTNEHGVELGNPQHISASLTRINAVLTKSQAKWLKEQAWKQNSNISVVLRNIIENFKK